MNYFWNLLKNLNRTILVLPIIFAVLSVLMIGSTHYAGEFVFTKDIKVQIIAYILGYGILAFTVFLDYKILEQYEKFIYIASILLLLTVYIPGLGLKQYGAQGWIDLGVIQFQPAEVVKISFIVLFSSFLCRHRDELYSFKGLIKAGLYMFPFIGIIIKLPDLGNALVFIVAAAVMIFAAGVDGKLYARIALACLACLPIAYRFMSDYQKDRIFAFLNPDVKSDATYHVWHSKISIGSGGIFGKGLFQGTYKELKYLPVQKSDFIFAVIIEELGLIGGLAVISLYAVLLFNIARIAANAKDLFGSLIATGILAMFFFQIFENIGMTMGLMPITGITLPFISYGGSSIITNMIALGIVLNIGIRSKLINFK